MNRCIHLRVDLRAVLVSLTAISVLAACGENVTPPQPLADVAPEMLTGASVAHELEAVPPPGSPDRLFYDVNLAVPGFGGLYLDEAVPPREQGPPVVLLTDPARSNDAREAVRPIVEGRDISMEGFRVVPAQFEWSELLQMAANLRGVMALEGVHRFGIDVRQNRVRVGAASEELFEGIRELAAQKGVPEEAIGLQISRPIPTLSGKVFPLSAWSTAGPFQTPTLSDSYRPAPGGVKITANWPCTMGFNVDGLPEPHFTIASHCTVTVGGVTGITVHQPTSFNPLGEEVTDPSVFSQGDPKDDDGRCGQGQTCRWADVALVEYDDPDDWALGEIARPAGITSINVVGRWFVDGRLQFPLVGETHHKVGYVTGWTSGTVDAHCEEVAQAHMGTTRWLLCQSVMTANASGGDSGSPVFRRTSSLATTVALAGQVWGFDEGDLWFSPFYSIDKHFGGPLDVEHPSPPPPPGVDILGPDEIQPEDTCTWVADVTSGTPPFSYEWRIGSTLVSTDSTYVGGRIGGTPNPFQLSLEVKDDLDQLALASMWVTEDQMADPCLH